MNRKCAKYHEYVSKFMNKLSRHAGVTAAQVLAFWPKVGVVLRMPCSAESSLRTPSPPMAAPRLLQLAIFVSRVVVSCAQSCASAQLLGRASAAVGALPCLATRTPCASCSTRGRRTQTLPHTGPTWAQPLQDVRHERVISAKTVAFRRRTCGKSG